MNYDFYITGTIGVAFDWWTGQRGTTAAQVKNFLTEHKDEELTIAVSSPGGYLDEGLTICELIKAHGKCNMVVMGMTASAATVLCMKAKSVKIAKGSMMLIHNSSYTLEVWTTANKKKIDEIIASFTKAREDLDTFDKAIAECYSSRNHKTLEDNLAQMDKEKWMLAQEAVDFGIADGILDDEETQTNAKAIKNVYLSNKGLAQHFGLPELPDAESVEKPKRRFIDRVMGALNNLTTIVKNEDTDDEEVEEPEEESHHSLNNNTNTMKKIVLNLVCALLAVADFTLNEKNETVLSEEQLNTIENDLKEKNETIAGLQSAKKKAEDELAAAITAKDKAVQNLADLQKAFDDFKKEAGDDSTVHPISDESNKGPVTAKEMYDDVKNLL